jgi:hypothetical protein
MAVHDDGHHAELLADGDSPLEQRTDGFGPGGSHDIEVVRLASQQQVAYCAADQIRLPPGRAEPANDFESRLETLGNGQQV